MVRDDPTFSNHHIFIAVSMTVTIFITAILNSIFDPDLATKAYFEYCKKRFHEKGIPVEVKDLEGSMYDLVYSHFQNIISVLKTDIHERLVAPFEQTLIEFSTIKPVLAYQLRGKEKLEALIAHTNEYSNDYQNVVSDEIKQEWLKDIFISGSKEIKEETLSELIDFLDKDILLLARHCGRSDFRDCKRVLLQKNERYKEHNFSELDSFIDTMLEKIMEASNTGSQQNISNTV